MTPEQQAIARADAFRRDVNTTLEDSWAYIQQLEARIQRSEVYIQTLERWVLTLLCPDGR